MNSSVPTKTIVSVAEMARMVGLSRARFYQLVEAGTFPPPVYDVRTRRPSYPEELQNRCLEVRRRNCGVNGRPVLFYARGHRSVGAAKPSRPATNPTTKAQLLKASVHNDLLEGLAALGMVAVKADQVEGALRDLYPGGVRSVDQGEVLRAVFLHLRRQNSGDNVGR